MSGDQVRFGATVTLADEDSDDEVVYTIVGAHEADIKSGRMSVHSPWPRALIGAYRRHRGSHHRRLKSYEVATSVRLTARLKWPSGRMPAPGQGQTTKAWTVMHIPASRSR